MEEEKAQFSGQTISFVLSLLALVLGGAGLYFGMTANQGLAPVRNFVHEGRTGLAEVNKITESYQFRINALDTRIRELESTIGRLKVYGNERDRKIMKMIDALEANNRQISKLSNQLVTFAEAESPAPAADSSEGITTASTVGRSSGSAGTYAIEAGDTFSRIATQQGVSLDALMDANPGVEPRRLRIGQIIDIPGN